MASVVFPSTLPGPSLSRVTPGERRMLSDLSGGPRQVRGVQRDYSAIQEVEWSLLSPAEALVLDQWWKNDLEKGGESFSATWPTPMGYVPLVVRFMGSPVWTAIPGGFWRVTSRVQIWGRALPPTDCVVETFSAGLGGYELASGTLLPFSIGSSIYGKTLQSSICATANDNSQILKSVAIRTLQSLSARFRITSINTDDACIIECQLSGATKLGFNPRRETFLDPGSLPRINLLGSEFAVAPAALLVDTWYLLEVFIIAGSNNSYSVLTKLSDNSLVANTTLTGNHTPPQINQFGYTVDDADRLTETEYTDIHIC